MDVQELLVTTHGHLARAQERVQAVDLPASENATAAAELRRARGDLERVSAYLGAARELADELTAGTRGAQWAGRRGDVDLLRQQCMITEEMTGSAARHLREARRAVGEDAAARFAARVDVAERALSDIVSGARAAERTVHQLTRPRAAAAEQPAVRRMRAAQREHQDRAVPGPVGPRR